MKCAMFPRPKFPVELNLLAELDSVNFRKGLPYYEVPANVLEDKSLLKEWADKAFQEAIKSKK